MNILPARPQSRFWFWCPGCNALTDVKPESGLHAHAYLDLGTRKKSEWYARWCVADLDAAQTRPARYDWKGIVAECDRQDRLRTPGLRLPYNPLGIREGGIGPQGPRPPLHWLYGKDLEC